MAGSFYNNRDSVDINELAALNDDISDDLIDKLQQQLSSNYSGTSANNAINENDDSLLFEETATNETKTENENETEAAKDKDTDTENNSGGSEENTIAETTKNDKKESSDENESANTTSYDASPQESKKKEKLDVKPTFDDNFIKKYKAKLQKKTKGKDSEEQPTSYGGVAPGEGSGEVGSNAVADANSIESLSQGNISERPLTDDLKNYNDSLDFLDGNVKYSKYVIYIDPENVDFIDKLTVKERKNLINGILRQQNDISITKQRFKVIQAIVRHIIILVLTISISIPVIYHVINASLEATINNHRNAQTNWQTLYREHGKITRN